MRVRAQRWFPGRRFVAGSGRFWPLLAGYGRIFLRRILRRFFPLIFGLFGLGSGGVRCTWRELSACTAEPPLGGCGPLAVGSQAGASLAFAGDEALCRAEARHCKLESLRHTDLAGFPFGDFFILFFALSFGLLGSGFGGVWMFAGGRRVSRGLIPGSWLSAAF